MTERLEQAKEKLAWALQNEQADFQAEIVDFYDGYRILFTKGSKECRKKVPFEWLDDCEPGNTVTAQMIGIIEQVRRELNNPDTPPEPALRTGPEQGNVNSPAQ